MGPICKAINLIESAWKLFPAEGREGKKLKYNHNTSETWFEMKPSLTPQNQFTLSNNLSRNCLPRKKGAGVKSCDKNIDIIHYPGDFCRRRKDIIQKAVLEIKDDIVLANASHSLRAYSNLWGRYHVFVVNIKIVTKWQYLHKNVSTFWKLSQFFV